MQHKHIHPSPRLTNVHLTMQIDGIYVIIGLPLKRRCFAWSVYGAGLAIGVVAVAASPRSDCLLHETILVGRAFISFN